MSPETGASGRIARLRARVEEITEQVATTAWTPVVIARQAYERDRDIGGAVLAGAIAFRVFVWMLAASLVAVAALGFIAASGDDPAEAADTVGMTAFAASSVAEAAADVQRSRWVLLAIGLYALYSASKNALRSIWVTCALVWRVPMTKPATVAGVAGYNAALLTLVIAVLGASRLRELLPGPGLGITLGVVIVFAVVMWFSLHRLPRPKVLRFTAVLPGALFLGISMQVMHLVSVLYLPHEIERSSDTYGSLGIAVAMLLWLYLFGRIIVFANVINATLWERYNAADAGDSPDLVGAGADPVMAAGLAKLRELRERARTRQTGPGER